MKNNLDRKIEKLFHIIFPYYKGELNMKEQKQTVKSSVKKAANKNFRYNIGNSTIKICLVKEFTNKNGETKKIILGELNLQENFEDQAINAELQNRKLFRARNSK